MLISIFESVFIEAICTIPNPKDGAVLRAAFSTWIESNLLQSAWLLQIQTFWLPSEP